MYLTYNLLNLNKQLIRLVNALAIDEAQFGLYVQLEGDEASESCLFAKKLKL